MMFATEGTVDVLGQRLGEVDVFDLRPRIGLTSAAVAEQVRAREKVIDLVLTASYAILARWKEEVTTPPTSPGRSRPSTRSAGAAPDQAQVLHPVRGRAQAGADRPGADARPRAAAARRAGRRAGPGRARGPAAAAHQAGPRSQGADDGAGHPPRRRGARRLHPRHAAAPGRGARGRPIEEVFTARNLSRCFGVQLEIEHRQSRWTARAR